MRRLEDYRGIVGDEVITTIYKKARPFYGKHILNINSTYIGGGVAEILTSLVPLLDDIGVATGWRILHGSPDFFEVTKKFHNALQGREINLTEKKRRLYEETNATFASYTHIAHDCVIIHDPQPLALIKFYRKRQPWIWRCHIDLTHPHKETWEFLKNFIIRYDVVVVSDRKYIKKDLPLTYKIIPPSIDPLSLKNKPLSLKDIDKYVKKVGIPQNKLVLLQVARFDPWKDPEGVVEVFKLVKKKVDCVLVYCYNLALDDPEGISLYSRMLKKTEKLREKGEIIFVRGDNQILVNAIQRRADVVIQKSIREGFCIAVTEAMWKEKAVVASNIGGLPLQIVDEQNGFLIPPHNNEGFAERIIQLLKDKKLREKIGKEAKERVRKKFLITRHILDYLDLFREVLLI